MKLFPLIALSVFFYSFNVNGADDNGVKAANLYKRITGTPLLPSDPRLTQMAELISNGKVLEAAHIATDAPVFYSVTVRNFASIMANAKETPLVTLDDFQADVIGAVRDDLDARILLTGNFRYEADSRLSLPEPSLKNNDHYAEIDKRQLDLKKNLVRKTPQWDTLPDAAGLLTTRAWAEAHYIAGTNRRATEYTFREFLCTPLEQWKDSNLPDTRVRRDIPRAPAGNPQTFQNNCRFCHAPLDGLTGAFAGVDFVNGEFIYGRNWVAPKMNQNNDVYPAGFVTRNSSWINLATQHQNEAFGWRGPLDGSGIQPFAKMVAMSRGFSKCMVKRSFKKIWRRDPTMAEAQGIVEKWTDEFEKEGYLLRRLFEKVSVYEN